MNIKLIMSKEDWKNICYETKLLEKTTPNVYSIPINNEIDLFKTFLENIKKSDTIDNKELIEYTPSAYIFFHEDILRNMISLLQYNKDIIENIYINNNNVFYYTMLDNIDNEVWKKMFTIEQQTFFEMFKHLVKLIKPLDFQYVMESLHDDYSENKSDKKIQKRFVETLLGNRTLENPHVESVLWHMLQITDVPHKVMKYMVTNKL